MQAVDYAKQINDFENHYHYNSSFLRHLLETSADGFAKLNQTLPLVGHRELLDVETYWVAKLATMKILDCGECLQLNVRMALENGLDKNLIAAVVKDEGSLPVHLQDIRDYTVSIATNSLTDAGLQQRIEAQLDPGQRLELGICIGTAILFPTIKRTAGLTVSCNLITIEI